MIKPGALVMAVVMVAVSAGTYFGLDKLPPELLPEALRRAPVETAAPVPVVTEPVAVASVAPAQAPAAAPAESPVTEEDLAEEPAPAATEPEVPAAAAAPAPAETPPAPQAAEVAAAEVSPAPAPAPRKPRPAPTDEQPNRAPVKASPPEADVIKPWWPDPAAMPAEQLKLQYAGQVQGENSIALLFSNKVNLDAVRKNAVVRTLDGDNVAGNWELGNNPKLVVFRNVTPGRYTVILNPEVADVQGYMLGTTLQGPVYIQQP